MSPSILKMIIETCERHHADSSRMILESPCLTSHIAPTLKSIAELNSTTAKWLATIDIAL